MQVALHTVVHCVWMVVDPRNVETSDWDDDFEAGKVAELATHHITPQEAEQVIRPRARRSCGIGMWPHAAGL